jgi:proteic killer suppression protein
LKITFSNAKLKDLANNDRKCLKEMGKVRSRKFKHRLNQLMLAENLEKTRNLSGNYHELVGNRKGQWSCDLDQPYRLIFSPAEFPIPTDKIGNYSWIEILSVEIIEIVDYH